MFAYILSLFFGETVESIDYEHIHQSIRPIIDQTSGTTSLFSYKDPLIKKYIWNMKYNNKKDVSVMFGKILGQYINENFSEQPITITNIPIHKRRLFEKGFVLG